MTDVLLTHSFFMRFDPKQEKAMMPYPPLGTLYAASVLEKASFTVALFDPMLADSEEDLRSALGRVHPAIVAIYDDDFNYLNKMCLGRMRSAAFTMAAIAKESGAFVIVHGSDAADHSAEYLDHSADVVIVGEGEQTLNELCGQLLRKEAVDFSAIPGIVYQKHGTIVRTEKRPVLKRLDTLPFPAWHLVDVEKYRSVWKKRHGYFSINMVTTRGCPFHCNWCAKPIYGQVYNTRSPANVVAEIKYLIQTISPDHIWFADDIFGLKPGWVQQFADMLHREGIAIRFKIQSRVDILLQDDTVEALAQAGCEEAWVGAESGSQKILDAMEKGTTVPQIYEARRRLACVGIRTAFFLQFGYPGEKREDINATITMVKDLLPDDIGISISYPLPGTTFYDRVKTELGAKHNWTDSDDLAMMFRGTFSPAYYRRLHRYVHKVFRFRKGIQLIGGLLRSKVSIGRSQLRSIALTFYFAPAALIDRLRLYLLEQQ